ncbi:MAG: peptidoglycan-binding protein [Clostridiales bacterium]|nr:peptidoglycan-binding protein [Clostridiales bacterium]
MAITIGSARHDENGAYSGGAAGDQLQTSTTNDRAGEVSMQAMYTHSKGWYILRPVSADHADKLAELMMQACNNSCIGYDQGNRLAIISAGISTTKKTECDCSSLVRACIIKATGADPGNFTTANEVTKLAATGLFEEKVAYVSQAKTPVYNGDVLVTKSKGHTVIVVSGNPRTATTTSSTSTTGGFDVSTLSTIKSGSTGAQVKSLQSLLNGKNKAGLAVDGDCGSKTVTAVKAYQTAQGLTVDGICGVNTWTALLTK